MKTNFITHLIIAGLLTTSAIASQDLYEYRVEIGDANEDIETFSVVFRKNITDTISQYAFSSRFTENKLQAYLDTSIFSWQSTENNLIGVAMTPTLAYPLKPVGQYRPYAEIGLGIAAISDTTIGHRDMSSALHFKSNITIGFHAQRFNIFMKAEHFSNAGLASPNWGLDVLSIGVGFKF